MARPSEEFFLAWSSLFCDDESPGWQAISLPSAGPVEVQVGRRSPDNAEAVLFCFPTVGLPRSERLPEGKGFLVEKTDLIGHNGLQLALTRQPAGSSELFASMACDIVGAIDDAAAEGAPESKLLRVFIGRVHAWQQFMSRGSGPLSPEAELGLAGELYFLAFFLEAGISIGNILKGWVGPDDAPQDFLLGEGAIEVKATMSSSGFPVKIGSLEQLDDAVASPLFLAAVRFARAEGGANLSEMVAEVERRLTGDPGAIEHFRERLMIAGYTEVHAGQYSRKFEPREKRFFSVTGGFPRLTPGVVPAQVTRALYEINLDHAGAFVCDFEEVLLRLGALQ